MKLQNLFNIIALLGLLFVTSCDLIETKKVSQKNNQDLIAQTDAKAKIEEKKVTIAQLISKDKGFSKFKLILEASDYLDTFKDKGANTIFAPTNVAFDKLPKGTLEKLLKPENKKQLMAVMKCLIIPGLISERDIVKAINARKGSVKLRTLGGIRHMASLKGDRIYLIDKNGNGGRLITTDVEASNGILHTIDAIMMPKK